MGSVGLFLHHCPWMLFTVEKNTKDDAWLFTEVSKLLIQFWSPLHKILDCNMLF